MASLRPRSTLPLIQSFEPAEQIHLLPLFDAYTIGVPRDCEPLLAQAYKRQVFNLRGGPLQSFWSTAPSRESGTLPSGARKPRQGKPVLPSTASIRKGIEPKRNGSVTSSRSRSCWNMRMPSQQVRCERLLHQLRPIGHRHHRDHNAAKNIQWLGQSLRAVLQ